MNPLLIASLAMGIGLFLTASAVPLGRASLAERLREFDVDVRVAERRRGQGRGVGLPIVSWEPLDALLRPLLEDLARPLRALLASSGMFGRSLETRLLLLDGKADVGGFVTQQILVALLIASWPTLLSVILGWSFGAFTIVLSLAGAMVGFILPYRLVEQRWRARGRRIEAELPQVLNLLALALTLLGLEGAIERVGNASAGIVGAEFRRVHEEVRLDRDLKDALRAMAERNGVRDLATLCSVLTGSRDQGLRLRESLQTMAAMLRERQANTLQAEGAKGSLKMLFPMALVLMPATLAVVVIPGLSALRGLGGP
jgi:tight adherence protein C